MLPPVIRPTLCLLLLFNASAVVAQTPASKTATLEQSLGKWTNELREEKKLVGLAAMVMVDGKVVAKAADGVRKTGSESQLTADDRFHLGSITKSFTATAAARLIGRGKIKWETTVVECFNGMEIHEGWKNATLEHFLTHRSGAPPNFGLSVMLKRPERGEARVKARRDAVAGILRNPPKTTPGEKYKYSNVGFTIAGAMLEQTTGKAWESLIQEEVFKPLELEQAGFGPPQDGKQPLSQPQGHRTAVFVKVAVGQTLQADNTPIMGPAGTVHMTLANACAYGYEHLVGEQGEGKLLQADAYRRLHKPRLSDYACGWVVPKTNRFTEGRIIWHNGSNTMWFAMLALLPELDAVVVVAANDGDIPRGQSASFDIIARVGKELAADSK